MKKYTQTAQDMARSVMERYTPEKVKWHYEHGVMMQALLSLATATENHAYEDFVVSRINVLVQPDGAILTYKNDEFNLDQINAGKVLLELIGRTNDPRYAKACGTLRDQLAHHPRTNAGGFWHKKIYPHQIWLDGLYMQGPFYARWGRDFDEPAAFDDVSEQLILTYQKTKNPSNGLLYHAWDEAKKQLWANQSTGCSPHFWGRAMGWYSMALVDVLDFLPQDHPNRPAIVSIIRELAPAILKVQDPESKLWYQVLNLPQEPKNYLETSATSMFIYFMAKATRLGYLDNPIYAQTAGEALSRLIEARVNTGGDGLMNLEGICSVAGLGGTPYRDGSFEYYVKEPVVANDFKGVGPFVMACMEVDSIS